MRRDLTLVFAPFTLLLALEVVRRVQGVADLPAAVGYVAVTALLAQPYLTMRLVRTVRPVPRWGMRVALGTFVVTTIPFYFLDQRNVRLVQLLTLAVVVGFFAVQVAAATLLAGEARRRTGAPRVRLVLAAGATAVLGLCLLVAGAGAARQAQPVLQVVGQVLALLSGAGYVVAFMPPRWLRRMWAGGAAYLIHHQIANAPATETPADIWRRYAATVRDSSGATAAVVLLPTDAGVECVARSGDAPEGELTTTEADLRQVMHRIQPVAVPATAESPLLSYAGRAGARTLVAVPVQLPTSARGALVLLSRRHPMFVEDDARLLGELGAHAAILAERGAAAAAVRALNAQLEERVEERTAELRIAQAALEDVNHQLEAQNRVLARSNEELQRFAYVASHDLQEPLRKIISFSGLLVERTSGSLDEDTQMYVDRIVGSASRMKRLIEDLLMFSRTGGAVELRPVDCTLALRSVLDSLALALAETGARVTFDALPIVLANQTQIEQLLQNLIGNALKYRSEAEPRVHVAAEELDGRWRLTITDNGIGIDMAYAERIFQVFQRLHPRGQYEGTGIGLAVCKRIVESNGGRIGVESAPGSGSKFWFVLPAAHHQPTQEAVDAVAQRTG
ncbi:MAG TPA: ATP-binding protein [Planosporangium sp.]|jgi:signal transduction histidine kinase|nr:ATP-binding protein [Planosporangium sp.]